MNEEQKKSFGAYLKEQLQIAGMSLSQFSQATGVAERHLEALLGGQFQKLPPSPYVRGYIVKIARALKLDEKELWTFYKAAVEVKTSGAKDILPFNRYAIKKVDKKWFIWAVILITAALYAGVNARRFLGEPTLQIINPSLETTITANNVILLQGMIDPANKLLISGEEVPLKDEGRFELFYSLNPGLNQIEFVVKKILGKEKVFRRQIIYEPPVINQ